MSLHYRGMSESPEFSPEDVRPPNDEYDNNFSGEDDERTREPRYGEEELAERDWKADATNVDWQIELLGESFPEVISHLRNDRSARFRLRLSGCRILDQHGRW